MLGGMTEGEHVEGGGGCAVQHLEACDGITSYWLRQAQFTTRID